MQENLARGLQVVSRAVSARNTLPVLANVLLKTEDAGLKLTATNLEIGVTYWVPGKIDGDGLQGALSDRGTAMLLRLRERHDRDVVTGILRLGEAVEAAEDLCQHLAA